MEYQRKRPLTPSAGPHQTVKSGKTPDPTAHAALQRGLQRLTSTPTTAQREVAQPVLRAVSLQRQEEEALSSRRLPLQRQVAELRPTLPAHAIASALQRQANEYASSVPTRPQGVGDWVTIMRHTAEQVNGTRMDARTSRAFTTMQRQVTGALVQGVKLDPRPTAQRHAEFAQHAVALQRHALTKHIPRAALSQLPPGERQSLQRAVDDALHADALQRQQDEQALKLHSLQRQLAELDEQATKPVMDRIQARRGSGNPLPAAVQRHLEQGLNYDLSAVRIHDDAEADKLAKGVNATAFTTGMDIYFRSGRFNPNTQSGLELLAHEVTHTVQQSQGRVGKGIDPDSALETEARAMGAHLAQSSPKPKLRRTQVNTRVLPAQPGPMQRQTARPSTTAAPRSGTTQGSAWRASGKLTGQPPVRDENKPPNINIAEHETEYKTLLRGAQDVLKAQRARADNLGRSAGKGVQDFNFWFAKVYSFVTENEILFAQQRVYDYPSYVMQCVLYFDKLYADNLKAFAKGKAEAHWAAALSTSKLMSDPKGLPAEAATSVWSMVAAMLAHIRFDLPRAEAWVFEQYQRKYGAKLSDVRGDFFRMTGVFDLAASRMMTVIQEKVGNVNAAVVKGMAANNLSDELMRDALGADMAAERLTTWRRMEAMVKQGIVPKNPYTLSGGTLRGDITASLNGNASSQLANMQKITSPSLRPSMDGIRNTRTSGMIRGAVGVLSSTNKGTLDEEMNTLEKRMGTVDKARAVPLYERAAFLLNIARNPAVDLKPGLGGGMAGGMGSNVLSLPTPRDDRLIVTVLQASRANGDLPLLMNMVDSYVTLVNMESSTDRLRAETILIQAYYPSLDALNAATLVRKWQNDTRNPANVTSVQRILSALPAPVRQRTVQYVKGLK